MRNCTLPAANPQPKTIAIVDGVQKTFSGRFGWSLEELVNAGNRGITPIERPAPRWSHYVFRLRRRGVRIETIPERHGGRYSGRHGRYRLKSEVRILGGAQT